MMKHNLQSQMTSVNIAKYRLKNVLSSDRIHCSSDLIEQMRDDIYHTISKYMEIEQNDFDMTLTRRDIYIRYTGEK